MRGVPLTPEQLARAAEVYTRTGNYSEAARSIDADVSATRKALLRHGEPERAKLHARACAAGIRKARRGIVQGLTVAARLLRSEEADGAGMEPKDVAALMNANARSAQSLLAFEARLESARQATLTRAKTRAEIAYLRARIAGTLPPDRHDLRSVTSVDLTNLDAVRARLAELLGPRAPQPEGAPGGAPAGGDGGAPGTRAGGGGGAG